MEKKEPKPLLPDYNANIENKHAPNPSWEKYKDIKKINPRDFTVLFANKAPPKETYSKGPVTSNSSSNSKQAELVEKHARLMVVDTAIGLLMKHIGMVE